VLPCLPWFVGLFDATYFIVFCRAVGRFLKFLFLLGWRKASSFANIGLRVGLCGLQMCLLCALAFHFGLFNT
jgi:hypothetical protein